MRVARSACARQMSLTRLSDRYGLGKDSISFLMLDGPTEVVCEISHETLARLCRGPNRTFENL
jgi:DNA-binding Xre family transcriptional regulator